MVPHTLARVHGSEPTLVEGAAGGHERSKALPLPPVPLPAVHGAVGVAILPRPVLLLIQQVSFVHLNNEGICR